MTIYRELLVNKDLPMFILTNQSPYVESIYLLLASIRPIEERIYIYIYRQSNQMLSLIIR